MAGGIGGGNVFDKSANAFQGALDLTQSAGRAATNKNAHTYDPRTINQGLQLYDPAYVSPHGYSAFQMAPVSLPQVQMFGNAPTYQSQGVNAATMQAAMGGAAPTYQSQGMNAATMQAALAGAAPTYDPATMQAVKAQAAQTGHHYGYDPRLIQRGQAGGGYSAALSANPNSIASGMWRYQNPYENQVVNRVISDVDRQRRIAQNQNAGDAAAAGAFGGSRHGLVEAETNRNAFDITASEAARLRRAGFDTAAGLSAQDIQNLQQNRQFNASAQNQARQFTAEQGFQRALANQSAYARAKEFGQGLNFEERQANAERRQEVGLANQDAAMTAAAANMQAANTAGQFNAQQQFARQEANAMRQQAAREFNAGNIQRARELMMAAENEERRFNTENQFARQEANLMRQQAAREFNAGNIQRARELTAAAENAERQFNAEQLFDVRRLNQEAINEQRQINQALNFERDRLYADRVNEARRHAADANMWASELNANATNDAQQFARRLQLERQLANLEAVNRAREFNSLQRGDMVGDQLNAAAMASALAGQGYDLGMGVTDAQGSAGALGNAITQAILGQGANQVGGYINYPQQLLGLRLESLGMNPGSTLRDTTTTTTQNTNPLSILGGLFQGLSLLPGF